MIQGPYVELNHERFSIELADTQEKRTLGLMFRDSMPEDHGMLFIFPGETRRSFWMKNTRIALDIFYFDSNLTLVSVAETHLLAAPPSALPIPATARQNTCWSSMQARRWSWV